jgi:hypothetical protein
MPRSANRPNTKVSEKKPNIPPPLRAHPPSHPHPPSQTHSQPPSMFDTMKQGFSFGVGSSIAHNIFNSKNKDETIKKNDIPNETKLSPDKIYDLYNKCLEKNDNNIDCNVILQNINNK